MSNKLTNVLIFAAGVAVGSVVTWRYVKTKYERIANEEIESVKEVFSQRKPKKKVEKHETALGPEQVDHSEYQNLIKNTGYSENTNYAEYAKQKKEEIEETYKEGVPLEDRPYVISPDEFDEMPDYDKISLTYYADKVLVDEDYDIVEDVDDVVGLDSLETFGQYEDDSVFVRDDVLKRDYEILLDLRNYSDIHDLSPHPVDD